MVVIKKDKKRFPGYTNTLRRGLFAAAWSIACITGANAATLQISPVSIELAGGTRGAAVHLHNPGDTPLVGQVRVFEWTQQQGDDRLRTTQSLVASPPLIKIAPGSEQLVRIVRSDQARGSEERAYRLLIDEIASDAPANQTGVQIQMRYSVPVFVDTPAKLRTIPVLEWTLVQTESGLRLRIENSGRQRARISAVSIEDAQGQTHTVEAGLLGYALAGRYRIFDLRLPAGIRLGPSARVNATVNAESLIVDARLQRAAATAPAGSSAGQPNQEP